MIFIKLVTSNRILIELNMRKADFQYVASYLFIHILVKLTIRYIPNWDELANVSRTMKQIFIINDMKNTHIKLYQSISVIMSF